MWMLNSPARQVFSSSGLQALPLPLPAGITRIEHAVMHARWAALPEFDAFGDDPVAAPVFGTGGVFAELLLGCFVLLFQLFAAFYGAALLRGNRAELAGQRAAVEIGVTFFLANALDFSFDADLAF